MHPPIGRSVPQPISLHGHNIEVVLHSSIIHPLQEAQIGKILGGHLRRRCQPRTQDHNLGVRFLGPRIPHCEEFGISFGIDGALAPFWVDIGLVPDLIVLDPPLVSADHSVDEVAVVIVVIGRGQGPRLISCCSAPGWRVVQASDDLYPVFLSQVDDVVILVPGGYVPALAVITKDSFAFDLDVFPGKLLPDPLETGIPDQAQGPMDLPIIHLLLQKSVDSVGVHPGVSDGQVRLNDWSRAFHPY
ncbi:MAG: hypothetical protein CEE40_10240 [Chloroflexi bacterium B3_Chlor]|nr:MAG: hypothetical protein CEE40_10240 [Chloroflexi bacterium B3_Chlor]